MNESSIISIRLGQYTEMYQINEFRWLLLDGTEKALAYTIVYN